MKQNQIHHHLFAILILFSSLVVYAGAPTDPVVTHPDGIHFAVEKQLPPPGKIWFADKFMEFQPFKKTVFQNINFYLEKITGEPLIANDDQFIYIGKAACRLKNTPEFLDKRRFLSFAYQQESMPTIGLTMTRPDPLELFAEADLFGFITLKAPLIPKFLDDQDIRDTPGLSDLLLQVTPVNLPIKVMSLRMTGKFNQMVSRMVMAGNFYQLSDTELLGTTYVLVSIDKGWKTSGLGGGLFQGYLARFIKDTMVKGLTAVEGQK